MSEKKEIKPIKQFTIVRRRWRRGKGTQRQSSLLLHPDDNKMCCLGFYMQACGVPREKLKDKGFPRGVVQITDTEGLFRGIDKDILSVLRKAKASWLVSMNKMKRVVNNSKMTDALVDANDNQEKSYKDIEKEVKTLFAKKGIKVKFK